MNILLQINNFFKNDPDINNLINYVKHDCSMRQNNYHAGSGLGGCPTSYLFLLSNNIQLQSDCQYLVTNDDGFKLHVNKDNSSVKKAREAISLYLSENHEYDCTFEQLLDLNFLLTRKPSDDILHLINAEKDGQKIKELLDIKYAQALSIDSEYEKEYRKLFEVYKYNFLFNNEMKDFITDISIAKAFEVDKLKEIKELQKEYNYSKYFSLDKEIEFINSFDKYPNYITAFVFRNFIGVDKIIRLCLDDI